MKRILFACVAVAFGASVVPAASPPVDAAIKKIQGVVSDPAKMKTFCELDAALEAAGEKEDPAVDKQIDDLVAKLGPDFTSAWEVGGELEEASADAKEWGAAIDAILAKCK